MRRALEGLNSPKVCQFCWYHLDASNLSYLSLFFFPRRFPILLISSRRSHLALSFNLMRTPTALLLHTPMLLMLIVLLLVPLVLLVLRLWFRLLVLLNSKKSPMSRKSDS